MILIDSKPIEAELINMEYSSGSVERDILDILFESGEGYRYDTLDQLKFELQLRREIVKAAKKLNRSGISFRIFRDSTCNPEYWDRTENGGFALKAGVAPSDAINDILENGSEYATECATGTLIVYYAALLAVYPKELFDRSFPDIYLMNWYRIESKLKEVGLMDTVKDYLPGDRRYFANPDVDPITPQWQGENVIDLNKGIYYGHGIGIHKPETFIRVLNSKRKEGAEVSAYLLDSVGRPNFKDLAEIYNGSIT